MATAVRFNVITIVSKNRLVSTFPTALPMWNLKSARPGADGRGQGCEGGEHVRTEMGLGWSHGAHISPS